MNSQKMLLCFYKKTEQLNKAKLKLKKLKKATLKLNNQGDLRISNVQAAADHYFEIKKYSDRVEKLPSDLREIQREMITVFKSIGLQGKKKLLVEHKHFGDFNFWYEGTYLHFDFSKNNAKKAI